MEVVHLRITLKLNLLTPVAWGLMSALLFYHAFCIVGCTELCGTAGARTVRSIKNRAENYASVNH